jgi:hypothetical protein
MVFVYQTGGKIPKEIIHNGLIYHHEWNADSLVKAKHIAKTRLAMMEHQSYIKKISYAHETVYAVYTHLSTSDRILKGVRWEVAGSAPQKAQAVKMGMDIYGKGNYKLIKGKYGYLVLRKARK